MSLCNEECISVSRKGVMMLVVVYYVSVIKLYVLHPVYLLFIVSSCILFCALSRSRFQLVC